MSMQAARLTEYEEPLEIEEIERLESEPDGIVARDDRYPGRERLHRVNWPDPPNRSANTLLKFRHSER